MRIVRRAPFVIGGEDLHDNHHAFPRSARFSLEWWALDVTTEEP